MGGKSVHFSGQSYNYDVTKYRTGKGWQVVKQSKRVNVFDD